MAKDKKEKKPRPKKYAEKVKLNISFEEAIKVLADNANENVERKLEEAESEQLEEAE